MSPITDVTLKRRCHSCRNWHTNDRDGLTGYCIKYGLTEWRTSSCRDWQVYEQVEVTADNRTNAEEDADHG